MAIQAIMLNDTDVTKGPQMASVLVKGTVNVNRLDAKTQALITPEVMAALPHVKFIKR